MLELIGIHQKGTGTATTNLATQLPLIAREFPEVAACHHGTINLNLDSPLFVIAPDHRTKQIHWNDKDFPDGEVFDWLRIQIEAPVGASPVNAWLYIPHGSIHRGTPTVHEVMANQRLNTSLGTKCKILIDRKWFETPFFQPGYLQAGIYVV
jgi:hypothetical protein